jgi:solute carrier family 12 (potassium/chloride transporters), member 9
MGTATDTSDSSGARGAHRVRPNFLTRTATDDAAQLDHRFSMMSPSAEPTSAPPLATHPELPENPYQPQSLGSPAAPREHAFTRKILGKLTGAQEFKFSDTFPIEPRRSSRGNMAVVDPTSSISQMQDETETKGQGVSAAGTRTGVMPRPVGGQGKLGTFSGVFVPTSLNVLSILMFLRFGLILGQSGFLGMMCT